MLVVTIEVWPGGNPIRKRNIGLLTLANISELADVSDYDGCFDGQDIEIRGHPRADGAWALVERALSVARAEDLDFKRA